MLEVKNISVFALINQEKVFLLKDLSFSLKENESLAIIGKSGAGKSTLANALLQIYDNNVFLESGAITLNSEPFSNKMRGKKVSLVFQNPNIYLNPLMKVGKQIEEMLTYHFKTKRKLAKEQSLSLMRKVGFKNAKEIYNYYPSEISGGEKQRVCLCIALICKPDVLILDEFVSSLDEESKNSLLQYVKNLQKELGFSLIIISHDFMEVAKLANYVAIMENGIIVEYGKKEEIFTNSSHPHTFEILNSFLQYYENIEPYHYNSNYTKLPEVTMLSDTHYVRFDNSNIIQKPAFLKKMKEGYNAYFKN